MKNLALVIISLMAIGLQLLSLPLSMAWFYANRQEIANTACVNRFEPTLLCSGKCVLQDIVVAHLGEAKPDTPTAPSFDLRISYIIADRWPEPLPLPVRVDRVSEVKPCRNFAYHLPAFRDFRAGILQPPRA